MLTAEEFRKDLNYDPDTGIITWARDQNSSTKAGHPAGSPNEDGYLCIVFKGRRYRAHRLAWFISSGEWPKDTIDHINGDKKDNRLSNLREATRQQNNFNRKRRISTFGLKGVSKGRRGKYRAAIVRSGKQYWLGEFKTPEEAHAAYIEGAKKLHGEFARFA